MFIPKDLSNLLPTLLGQPGLGCANTPVGFRACTLGCTLGCCQRASTMGCANTLAHPTPPSRTTCRTCLQNAQSAITTYAPSRQHTQRPLNTLCLSLVWVVPTRWHAEACQHAGTPNAPFPNHLSDLLPPPCVSTQRAHPAPPRTITPNAPSSCSSQAESSVVQKVCEP